MSMKDNESIAHLFRDIPDIWAKGSCTVAVAVRDYSFGRTHLYHYMNLGLPYTLTTGRRLIPRLALEKLLTSGLVNAPAEASR
jgi:hypothetical protein